MIHPTLMQVRDPRWPGWLPSMLVQDILAIKDELMSGNYMGPWTILHGFQWDRYLDDDYESSLPPSFRQTLRQRLRDISNIVDVAVLQVRRRPRGRPSPNKPSYYYALDERCPWNMDFVCNDVVQVTTELV